MPAEKKVKSTVRQTPYGSSRILIEPYQNTCRFSKVSIDAPPLPLGTLWQPVPDSLSLKRTTDFASRLSAYLKSKNEAYKKELEKMEEALTRAEESKKNLKETITTLGNTVEALEGAVTAASHILSTSLACVICFETSLNPTSLKCGHSFCRSCLQRWFFSKFEDKSASKSIDLTKSEYTYIYTPTSTASEAEHNMVKFATLSNRIKPDYKCPSCRDPLLPSLRNSFLDFKLTASLNTLNALIGYVHTQTDATPEWKLASIDMLSFLNSRFFSSDCDSERRFSASDSDHDMLSDSDV